MATVKNTDYIEALKALGFNLPPDFNSQGKQHGEFKDRVIQFLATGGQGQANDEAIRAASDLWNKVDDRLQSQDDLSWGDVFNPVGHFFGNIGGHLADAGSYIANDAGQVLSSLASAPSTLYQGLETPSGGLATPDYTKLPSYTAKVAPPPGTPPPAAQAFPNYQYTGNIKIGPDGKAQNVPPPNVQAPTIQAQPKVQAPKGGAPGGPGGGAPAAGGAGGLGAPPPTTPDQLDLYIKQNAGSFAWFNDIPEVKDLIYKLAAEPGDLTAKLGRFDQQVQQTQWWKNTDSYARQFHSDMQQDPGSVLHKIGLQATSIGSFAKSQGVNIDPARLQQIAQSAVQYNWGPEDIDRAVAAEYHYDPNGTDIGGTATTVKSMADNYVTPLSNQAIQSWTQAIMGGQSTTDDFKRYLGNQAKGLFPWLSSEIDQGHNVHDLLEPSRQRLATTLQINPNTIDWSKSQWSSLLSTRDAKGVVTPTSDSDMERIVKTDPTYGWDKTSDALRSASNTASSILKSFGMM